MGSRPNGPPTAQRVAPQKPNPSLQTRPIGFSYLSRTSNSVDNGLISSCTELAQSLLDVSRQERIRPRALKAATKYYPASLQLWYVYMYLNVCSLVVSSASDPSSWLKRKFSSFLVPLEIKEALLSSPS